jgi:YidC/Oxa1 family membrane protein insertase
MLVSANIFQPLISVFQSVISFFHDSVGLSWGWSIILMTICVRIVLVPLMLKQFRSMRRLQQHTPELKALQKKYKEDKQRQQQEVMKFYKENNVNPLSSCMPMVLQLPVMISLFYMLRKNLRTDICPKVQHAFQNGLVAAHKYTAHTVLGQTTYCTNAHYAQYAHKGASFLFIHDITNTASGLTLVVLLVLYVGTQLVSTMIMAAPTMDKTQRQMMMAMPLLFVVFIIRFPAGLIVYWITTNAWTMAQQFAFKRILGPPAISNFTAAIDEIEVDERNIASRLKGLLGRPAEADTNGLPRAGTSTNGRSRPNAAPPPPPRKKRKRSGRRR